MTEKRLKPDNKAQFIVKRVGFQYNVNKNSIEYDGKHFAYCNGEEVKIARKLNELADENKALKSDRARYEEECRLDVFKELSEENEQLKQDIENLKITIDARETLIDVCEKKFKELGYIITVDDDGYVIE